MPIYSHSKLSTFEQCPLKFRFRYIDKLKPEIEQTIEGFLGKKIHETLEWVYNQVRERRLFELDEIIEYYAQSWKRDYNPEIRIVKNSFDTEHYFNKGIRFLVDYFLKNSPFKDNTIAIEKKVIIDLDYERKYKLIGYIDRLVHHKDTDIFEIHDYKTSSSLKTQEQLDQDRQLALYSIAIRDYFENVSDVHLVWHFLDFNEKLTSKRTLEQLENLKREIIELINKIESTTDFPPKESGLCNWCEFRIYCPLMKDRDINGSKEFSEPTNSIFDLNY